MEREVKYLEKLSVPDQVQGWLSWKKGNEGPEVGELHPIPKNRREDSIGYRQQLYPRPRRREVVDEKGLVPGQKTLRKDSFPNGETVGIELSRSRGKSSHAEHTTVNSSPLLSFYSLSYQDQEQGRERLRERERRQEKQRRIDWEGDLGGYLTLGEHWDCVVNPSYK